MDYYQLSEKLGAALIVTGDSGADILIFPSGNISVDNNIKSNIPLAAHPHASHYTH